MGLFDGFTGERIQCSRCNGTGSWSYKDEDGWVSEHGCDQCGGSGSKHVSSPGGYVNPKYRPDFSRGRGYIVKPKRGT